jgi:hypothetical protein
MTMLKATTVALALAALGVGLTGCGDSSSSTSAVEKTPSPSVKSSAPVKPKPTRAPFAPDTGKYALRLGQTREGQYILNTLVAVKRPMVASNPYMKPDDPSQEFMGANVRTCVKKSTKVRDTIAWSDWAASAGNGNIYTGSDSSWDGWPSPQYPPYKVLSPGECVAGWLLIPVPKGQRMVKVSLAPIGDATAAEWILPRA